MHWDGDTPQRVISIVLEQKYITELVGRRKLLGKLMGAERYMWIYRSQNEEMHIKFAVIHRIHKFSEVIKSLSRFIFALPFVIKTYKSIA
jgi:hypothetical protein